MAYAGFAFAANFAELTKVWHTPLVECADHKAATHLVETGLNAAFRIEQNIDWSGSSISFTAVTDQDFDRDELLRGLVSEVGSVIPRRMVGRRVYDELSVVASLRPVPLATALPEGFEACEVTIRFARKNPRPQWIVLQESL